MSKIKRHIKKNKIFIIIIIVLIVILGLLGLFYFKEKDKKMKALSSLYFEGLNEKQEVGKGNTDIKYKLGCSNVVKYPTIGNKKIDKKIKSVVKEMSNKFIKEYGNEINISKMEEISYYQYIDYETYLAPDNTMSIIFNEAIEANDSNVLSEKNYVYNFSIDTGEVLKNSYLFIGDYKSPITSYLDKFLNDDKNYKEFLNNDYKNVINNKTDYKYAVTNKGLRVYFDKYEICSGNKGLIKITVPYTSIEKIMNINIGNVTKKLKANTGVKAGDTTYKVTNKKMFLKQLVNFYKKDNKNSKLISNINKGEDVVSIEESDNGWTKISYNDKTGYVNSSYLSDKVVAVEGFDDVNETVYAISSLNIRKSFDANSEKLGTLFRSDSITRVGVSKNGWSEVVYNDNVAYIYSSYLSTTKPVDTDFNLKVDPQRGIDPNKPMVALSFDDGPNPRSTPRILNTLAKYNVVATFFDLGNLITSYPNVVKKEEAQGCEVGSHTYDHANLNKLSTAQIQDEMSKSEASFMSVLGHKPTIVRPPYGSANQTVRASVNYPLVNWDIDTLDWKSRNKDAILNEFRKTSNYDGKIVLMHSIYGTTADAVEVIVPELLSKGYQIVTISELAAYKGVRLEAGHVYYNFN